MYLPALVPPIVMPGFSSSPRIRRPPRIVTPNPPAPEQPKALAVPASDSAGFHDKRARLPILPDRAEPDPQKSIRHGHFRVLHGPLENAGWVARCEYFKLKSRTTPKPHGK
jgi:hypothetical protein